MGVINLYNITHIQNAATVNINNTPSISSSKALIQQTAIRYDRIRNTNLINPVKKVSEHNSSKGTLSEITASKGGFRKGATQKIVRSAQCGGVFSP